MDLKFPVSKYRWRHFTSESFVLQSTTKLKSSKGSWANCLFYLMLIIIFIVHVQTIVFTNQCQLQMLILRTWNSTASMNFISFKIKYPRIAVHIILPYQPPLLSESCKIKTFQLIMYACDVVSLWNNDGWSACFMSTLHS